MVVSASYHGRGEGKSCWGAVHKPAMYPRPPPPPIYIYWASNPGQTDPLLQPEQFLLSFIYESPLPLTTESLSILLAFSKNHFRFYWPAPILFYISSIFALIVLHFLPFFLWFILWAFPSFLSGKLICFTWKFFSFITFNAAKHAPSHCGSGHIPRVSIRSVFTAVWFWLIF